MIGVAGGVAMLVLFVGIERRVVCPLVPLGVLGRPGLAGANAVTIIQAAVNDGAQPASSPQDVAARSEIVLASLPNPASVLEAALGESGVIHGIRDRGVFIDLSTIDPVTSRTVHSALAEKGARMLDCPVGKGPQEARMWPAQMPYQPTVAALHNNGRHFPPNYLHDSWLDYLYWDTELEP